MGRAATGQGEIEYRERERGGVGFVGRTARSHPGLHLSKCLLTYHCASCRWKIF